MVATMVKNDNDGVVLQEAIDGGAIDALWWRRRYWAKFRVTIEAKDNDWPPNEIGNCDATSGCF